MFITVVIGKFFCCYETMSDDMLDYGRRTLVCY